MNLQDAIARKQRKAAADRLADRLAAAAAERLRVAQEAIAEARSAALASQGKPPAVRRIHGVRLVDRMRDFDNAVAVAQEWEVVPHAR